MKLTGAPKLQIDVLRAEKRLSVVTMPQGAQRKKTLEGISEESEESEAEVIVHSFHSRTIPSFTDGKGEGLGKDGDEDEFRELQESFSSSSYRLVLKEISLLVARIYYLQRFFQHHTTVNR